MKSVVRSSYQSVIISPTSQPWLMGMGTHVSWGLGPDAQKLVLYIMWFCNAPHRTGEPVIKLLVVCSMPVPVANSCCVLAQIVAVQQTVSISLTPQRKIITKRPYLAALSLIIHRQRSAVLRNMKIPFVCYYEDGHFLSYSCSTECSLSVAFSFNLRHFLRREARPVHWCQIIPRPSRSSTEVLHVGSTEKKTMLKPYHT